MKTVEFRRHTNRQYPDVHLSQNGITLARRMGKALPDFDKVITSDIPRAVAIAIAMGLAVDKTRDELMQPPPEMFQESG